MPDTAKSAEVQRLFRRNTYLLIAGAVMTIIAVAIVGVIANAGRIATEDNITASAAQFATQIRSACITDRRSAESAAAGAQQDALFLALRAIEERNSEAFDAAVRVGEDATRRRQAAELALEPEVLNAEPPVGCGPPITSSEQLDDTSTTGSNE